MGNVLPVVKVEPGNERPGPYSKPGRRDPNLAEQT